MKRVDFGKNEAKKWHPRVEIKGKKPGNGQFWGKKVVIVLGLLLG